MLEELKLTSSSDYKNFLRMDAGAYEELLAMVKPYIEKKNTNMRDSISAHERLSATLRFLATGRSYADLKFSTPIAKCTLSIIIIETCQAIRKLPKNEGEWRKVANGRVSDGGVFSNTKFGCKFENKELNIPAPKTVNLFPKKLPYVIVADDAFPLSENLMKPYSYRGLSKEQEHINYRLSRARNVVENTFGIISSRFRILLTTIHLSPDKTTEIVLAICYLHNYLRAKSARTYIGSTDIENSTTKSSEGSLIHLQCGKSQNSTHIAKGARNDFCEYFSSSQMINDEIIC